MSDRVDSVERQASLTRREFTLEAALALLAGCVITVSEACGGKSTPTTPAPTPAPADVAGTISANHGHTATITGAEITAANDITLNIQGNATHNHTVAISQADLRALASRQSVSKTSSTDNNHQHTVTFTPA